MPTVVLSKLMSDSIIHYPLGNWNDYPDAPIILRAGKHNKIIRLKDLPEVFEKQTINLHDVELGSYANTVSDGFVFYLNADANYIILDCNNWNKWLLENKWVKVAGGYSAMKYPTTVIRLSEYTSFFFVHRDYGNGVSHLQLIGKNGKRITLRLPPYIRKLSGYRETPDGLILTALKKKYSQILYIRLKGNLGVFLLDTVPIRYYVANIVSEEQVTAIAA